jgi:23S rRNA (cytidine2498-2'-O)-methyltransferase
MTSPGAVPAGAWLAYCRAGFEGEAGAELAAQAQRRGLKGDLEAGSGWVLCRTGAAPLPPLGDLVFARQVLAGFGHCAALPPGDRVAPLAATAAQAGTDFRDLWVESPDTNEGKSLSPLCRGLAGPLRQALLDAGVLKPDAPGLPRLHVFLVSGREARLGLAWPGSGCDWPMGIPRLKLPREAPSRSALKLAEALLTLVSADELGRLLRPGMRAVDLGAAPGGWSWQLARRGVHVTALDNGRLAPQVLATGMVEHLRADGFTWRPPRPVDWLVCDMVDRPGRIAALVADWFAGRRCRNAIFNLKLPMKRRREEVERCRALIGERLADEGIRFRLRIRQLYHDREEVTAFLARA